MPHCCCHRHTLTCEFGPKSSRIHFAQGIHELTTRLGHDTPHRKRPFLYPLKLAPFRNAFGLDTCTKNPLEFKRTKSLLRGQWLTCSNLLHPVQHKPLTTTRGRRAHQEHLLLYILPTPRCPDTAGKSGPSRHFKMPLPLCEGFKQVHPSLRSKNRRSAEPTG